MRMDDAGLVKAAPLSPEEVQLTITNIIPMTVTLEFNKFFCMCMVLNCVSNVLQ